MTLDACAAYGHHQSAVSGASAGRCLAVGNDVNPGVYADSWNGAGGHLVSMVVLTS